MPSTMVRPESTPPVAAVLARVKSVGASLKVKWTVEELAATLTSWLSMVTAAVGVDGIDGEGKRWGDGIDGEAAGVGCGAGVAVILVPVVVDGEHRRC